MNNPTSCPDCLSTNIKYFDARKTYTCMDCGFSFTEKEYKKLRIFLSYGHDENEELVRMIKADLEQRGHDVWFDKNEIKFGDDWRRSITDGITGSHRVLSFLSKHSARDPGVCRDEIAIAIGVKGGNIQTILVESEDKVQPPVNISHIQWLDMHKWKEKKSVGWDTWEIWYGEKLSEIIHVVESDESRRFAGEIDTLSSYLKPVKSEARINQLLSNGFYGRQWLFEAVEHWRLERNKKSRLFWIMGAPGVGKSAFAAQLTHIRSDAVVASQFCEWDKPDHRNAGRVVCSIAFQMATRLPDYRKLLLTLPEIKALDQKDASELFDYLLANPLKSVINGGREKLLIVIDALDEAGESGRNSLVEMLARNALHLPDWLGMVVTSRPEFDVKTPFQALNPLTLDTKSESNKADIRDYLSNKLAIQFQNKPNAEALVNQILEKSEGIFLYAERFCEDVHKGYLSLDHPEQFPQGLGGIFYQYFKRQFPDLKQFRKDVRPALRAILAAREPLPLEILQELFNWEDEELQDFIHILGSLFPVTKTTYSETFKPYHKSLTDWMGDEGKAGVYFVSEMEGHRMLVDFGWSDFANNANNLHDFFLCHLAFSLIQISDVGRLLVLLASSAFQERSPVFADESFYKDIIPLLPESCAIAAVSPAMEYFVNRAADSSPERLGYTLFPHEPGVVFVNGTHITGRYSCDYWIPPGAKEPPSEVLWSFLTVCHSLLAVTTALLRGIGSRGAVDWYCDFWERSRLDDVLCSIDRYYNGCYQHLSDKAGELSWQINEAAKKVLVTLHADNIQSQESMK